MPEFLTETGEFTDDFKTALPDMLGEEHKDSKVFDDIPSIAALVKSHADTKAAVGKKLENVIQKPGENATEEEMSVFKAAIAAAAGAPAEATEYEFYKAETLPEGLERSQEAEDKFRQIFFEHKTPKPLVKALSQAFEEIQIGNYNAIVEANKAAAAQKADEEQRAFDEGCNKLRTENPGDKLASFTRVSLAAIQKYGDEELVKKLKAANMYENATDLAKWREAGVPLETLRLFHKIGTQTLDAKLLGGGGGGGGDLTEDEKLKKMYPNTKD